MKKGRKSTEGGKGDLNHGGQEDTHACHITFGHVIDGGKLGYKMKDIYTKDKRPLGRGKLHDEKKVLGQSQKTHH